MNLINLYYSSFDRKLVRRTLSDERFVGIVTNFLRAVYPRFIIVFAIKKVVGVHKEIGFLQKSMT